MECTYYRFEVPIRSILMKNFNLNRNRNICDCFDFLYVHMLKCTNVKIVHLNTWKIFTYKLEKLRFDNQQFFFIYFYVF